MAKKKSGKAKKNEDRRAVKIPLIPIARYEGVLDHESALSWLYDDLPGFQALIRLGLSEQYEATTSGSAALAYGVERMTKACVDVVRSKESLRIVSEEPESWSALRALDGILGSAASSDWKDFLDVPDPMVLDAITRLVEGGLVEIEQAHKKAREIEQVLDGPRPEKLGNLSDLVRELVERIGPEGVVSLLCDFDSRELRAFIRGFHRDETDTREDIRRVLFGTVSEAEARA